MAVVDYLGNTVSLRGGQFNRARAKQEEKAEAAERHGEGTLVPAFQTDPVKRRLLRHAPAGLPP
jgi:hypothetical protein